MNDEVYKDPESLKEALDRLDSILSQLESGEKSLEESFGCYEEGLKLIKYANSQIDRVEKKCQILEGGELHEF